MTRIAVTGATGHLGRLVIESLLAGGIAPGEIRAVVRSPKKAADLAARGVEVREGDYSRTSTLPRALEGVDRLLLISGSEVGRRVPQHTAVVEAAALAGVQLLAYTSVLRADTTELVLAPDHTATEAVIRAAGIPFTFLRNGPYLENYTGQLGQYLATGRIVGASGDAAVSGATRSDFADAGAAVLVGEGHQGAVYELGGPAFTMSELAAAITEVTGKRVEYVEVPVQQFVEGAKAADIDPGFAEMLGVLEQCSARGDWRTDSVDLERLLGRAPTSLVDAVREAYAGLAV